MSAHLSVIAAALLLFAFACGPTPDPGRDPDASLPDPQADSGVDAGGEDPADAGVDAGIFPRPDTFLLSRPQNFTTSPDAAFTFVANATGRSFECSLDSAQFSACTSPFKTTALADGPHDFKVRALDANGEPDLTPDQDSWTVDTVVPDTTITAAPTGDVTEPRGTVVMSCDEADCLFECALNGGAYFPCTSPHSFEGLSSGAQSVLIRASDRAGNADATPASASWNVLPGEVTVRIAAANLSSGNGQSYDTGHGIRIFQGLGPDIVLIQELNYGQNTPVDIRAFVDTAFSPSFSYFRENNTLPNGVISRFPIVASGVWDDTLVTNRDFAWARINLPGPRDLWAVSIHLLTTSASNRQMEAAALVAFIQANVPAGDLLVVGGDVNTGSRNESALTELSAVVVTAAPHPADAQGNTNTNANRSEPYDWVLVDSDLNALRVPTVIGAASFSAGLVFDSRVFSPLSDVSPVMFGDSATSGMQHMAVIKDFTVSY